jgi:hypothetical protein
MMAERIEVRNAAVSRMASAALDRLDSPPRSGSMREPYDTNGDEVGLDVKGRLQG